MKSVAEILPYKTAKTPIESGFSADASFLCPHYGGREWIRTTEVEDNRFTVCPLWPLGNSPMFSFGTEQVLCYYSKVVRENQEGRKTFFGGFSAL